MVFADLFFLFIFLPLFILLYGGAYLAEKKSGGTTARNAVLILFSLIFYVWGEPVCILLLILGVVIDYICAKAGKEILGIVLHLLLLAVFKYGNLLLVTAASTGIFPFLTTAVADTGTLPAFVTAAGAHPVSIRLPIGISFYTFQSVSYLADVRAKKCEPQKSFLRLLLYISMFPQLIAGPIVRYTAVAEQIEKRSVSENDLAEGIRRFITGLAKKVILADQLGVIVEQTMGTDLSVLSAGMAWLGLIAFSLQIYYDFSGYSDMAIGMGRCMGFSFPENFDRPYLCSSVTDFWRRWHISLGSFFRDYVYIPLGGNRGSKIRWVFNILLVWALTGFWHGASWNYLIWGVYFGVLLLLEKMIFFGKGKKKSENGKGSGALAPVIGALHRLLSLLLVVLGWGIFYFEDFGRMRQFFTVLFGMTQSAAGGGFLLKTLLSQNAFLLAAAILLCAGVPAFRRKKSASDAADEKEMRASDTAATKDKEMRVSDNIAGKKKGKRASDIADAKEKEKHASDNMAGKKKGKHASDTSAGKKKKMHAVDAAKEEVAASGVRENDADQENGALWVLRAVWSVVLLAVSVLLLIGASTHPFLYTRF